MACENTMTCTCSFTSCTRHGKCCECIAYHCRMGEAPGCMFSKEAEKTGNRSIENLYRDYMNSKNR